MTSLLPNVLLTSKELSTRLEWLPPCVRNGLCLANTAGGETHKASRSTFQPTSHVLVLDAERQRCGGVLLCIVLFASIASVENNRSILVRCEGNLDARRFHAISSKTAKEVYRPWVLFSSFSPPLRVLVTEDALPCPGQEPRTLLRRKEGSRKKGRVRHARPFFFHFSSTPTSHGTFRSSCPSPSSLRAIFRFFFVPFHSRPLQAWKHVGIHLDLRGTRNTSIAYVTHTYAVLLRPPKGVCGSKTHGKGLGSRLMRRMDEGETSFAISWTFGRNHSDVVERSRMETSTSKQERDNAPGISLLHHKEAWLCSITSFLGGWRRNRGWLHELVKEETDPASAFLGASNGRPESQARMERMHGGHLACSIDPSAGEEADRAHNPPKANRLLESEGCWSLSMQEFVCMMRCPLTLVHVLPIHHNLSMADADRSVCLVAASIPTDKKARADGDGSLWIQSIKRRPEVQQDTLSYYGQVASSMRRKDALRGRFRSVRRS